MALIRRKMEELTIFAWPLSSFGHTSGCLLTVHRVVSNLMHFHKTTLRNQFIPALNRSSESKVCSSAPSTAAP